MLLKAKKMLINGEILCSQIERLNIAKVAVLSKSVYRCKFLVTYFVDINKLILKFIWTGKRPKRTNKIIKKNKVRGLTKKLDQKTCYNTTVNIAV